MPIRTAGDRRSGAGDKSRFVKEIEEALLRDEVDLAVHSAKDLPGSIPDGLAIVAVPERADARDALCGAPALDELGEGAVVATSSLRRRAQLLAIRPDLQVMELRGNVDTRLRRLDEGDFDALVLAVAGLTRLDRGTGSPFEPEELTPAPGQGCLAVEARAGDERVRGLVEPITEHYSLATLTAERALVAALDASCRTPVGAHAVLSDGELRLSAFVGLPDGSAWIRDRASGAMQDPGDVGRLAAARIVAAGGVELLAEADRLAQAPL